jgi:hypothetical protein
MVAADDFKRSPSSRSRQNYDNDYIHNRNKADSGRTHRVKLSHTPARTHVHADNHIPFPQPAAIWEYANDTGGFNYIYHYICNYITISITITMYTYTCTHTCIPQAAAIWEYATNAGGFNPYPAADAAALEAAFTRLHASGGGGGGASVRLSGGNYVVDVSAMRQRTVDSGYVRDVRRRDPTVSCRRVSLSLTHTLSPPPPLPSWSSSSSTSPIPSLSPSPLYLRKEHPPISEEEVQCI